jgi:hypothetical protein
MSQQPPESNARQNLYVGYTAEVTTPSLTAYPAESIRNAMTVFDGMTILISEKLGLGRPRVSSISPRPGAGFGKAFDAEGEISDFGEKAILGAVQHVLSAMRPEI